MPRTSAGPIYAQVQGHLEALLASGELAGGKQVPSERQLMARFKTSNMPVRQAIQHFIDKGIFERIHGRGTFVRASDTTKTQRLAVLYVYDNAAMWASPFYTEIMRGIEDITLSTDQRLILHSVGDNDIYTILRKLEDEVDGFLIVDLFPSMVPRVEKYIREKRKPLVVVNYPHAWSQASSVITDNVANTRALVQHLIDHGHRHIAYLYHRSAMATLHELHPSAQLKEIGYRQALADNGVAVAEDLIREIHRDNIDDLLGSLVAQGVTAIACASSFIAVRFVMPTAKRRGLRVPEDLSLVVYDNTRDTLAADYELCAIDIDIASLGSLAAERLLHSITTPNAPCANIALHGRVLTRRSVATRPR